MQTLDHIAFTPDTDALLEQVRVRPGSRMEAEVRELLARATDVARPKAVFTEEFIAARGGDTVTVGGITFTSHVLRLNLDEVERVFPYIATCGVEFDALLPRDGDEYLRYCLDCIKEMALFAASEYLRLHLADNYGLTHCAAMNPGSGDEDIWPIQEQAPLFALLGDVEGAIGVRLSDTFLMTPNKTVSGIMYPSEVDFFTCQLCHREDCPRRRAPFDAQLYREKHGGMAGHM
jgi:hypothetical protein